MPSMYPGATVPEWTPEDGLPHLDNPTVRNVPLEFGRLRSVGDFIAVSDAGLIPGRKYTDTQIGRTEARMHFQGVQRMGPPNDDVLLVTGGDAPDRAAHLFVCRLGSRRRNGPWGTNLRFKRKPPATDRLEMIWRLDNTLWHAGGLSLLGDMAIVPLEGDSGASRIVFIDLTDPMDARKFPLPLRIERTPEIGKAGAVALTRMPNQHYLCAVWTDSDHRPPRLDLYLSVDTNLLNGFRPEIVSWEHDRLLPAGGARAAYQTINFITQSDGELFLIGTENTSNGAPYVRGIDRVDLLHIELTPATARDAEPVLELPTVTRVAEKTVECDHDFGNLDAAGGIFLAREWAGLDPEPEGRLILYAAYHWRVERCIRLIEFARDHPITMPPVHDIEEGWIDLFEHPNFRGRRLTIMGTQDAEIPDYGSIFVQDSGFSNRVSSVRFQLPQGVVYRLYRDDKFKPKTTGNLGLEGNGLVCEIRDLNEAAQFDNAVSSSRYD